MNDTRETAPAEHDLDPEAVAALLDGRLAPDEREALLRRIEASPDAVAILADAAAAVDNEEGVDAGKVIPLRRRPTVTRPARWLLAAVIATLALLPVLRLTLPGSGSASAIALLSQPNAPLPHGWDQAPWAVTRGAGAAADARRAAVRAGYLITTAELAARSRDPEAATAALAAAAALEQIPGGGGTAQHLRSASSDTGAAVLRDLAAARRSAVAVLGRDEVLTGDWLAVARVAAAARDDGFFHSRQTRRRVDGGLRSAAEPALRAAWRDLHVQLDGPRDWPRLVASVDSVLRLA